MLKLRLGISIVIATLVVLAVVVSSSEKLDVDGYSRAYLFSSPDVDDIGLADIDSDGHLDIFTTNHSLAQQLRLNTGEGTFSGNRVVNFGLSQDAHYPGLDLSGNKPDIDGPGIYIYFWYLDGSLVIVGHGIPKNEVIKGRLHAPWKLKVSAEGDSGKNQALLSEISLPGNIAGTQLDFEFSEDGVFRVYTYPAPTMAIPYRIQFIANSHNLPVYIGANKVEERGNDIHFQLKDRHGMAFADINDDGHADVFISRGGLRGMLDELMPQSLDELFVWTGARFADDTVRSNILKQGCPGRGTSWVDYDGDGDLDLYQVCGRTKEPSMNFPNRLYRRRHDERFEEIAQQSGVGIEAAGAYAWMDWNGDKRQDLVWVSDSRIVLYSAGSGEKFKRVQEADLKGINGVLVNLVYSDYDNDGDLDIFVSSRDMAYLVVNDSGKFRVMDPAAVGLPEKANAASWVDYNHDGAMDLHTIPGGIYLNQNNGRFRSVGDFSFGWLPEVRDGRISWADLNGDGSLDMLLAFHRVTLWQKIMRRLKLGDDNAWQVYAYLSRQEDPGNWLGLRIQGAPGNSESIGARVTLRAEDMLQVQQVGQFEGSRYSQGNYTVNFGLGSRTAADSITVEWPDGASKVVNDVMANRVISVKHD
jgi:hypothetical protein